jgi:hypothetical protein
MRPEPGHIHFRAYLSEIGLNKNRANECERIGAIPKTICATLKGGSLAVQATWRRRTNVWRGVTSPSWEA